ncbi:MAG: tyrosine-type recombinase/integrase, partial [Planctomycetota bacterium]
MASVFRPTYTVPIPVDAELSERNGKRFARVKRNGKTTTVAVTTKGKHAGKRILVEARYWAVEFVNEAGHVHRRKGFADKRATEELAGQIQRSIDRKQAGIIDQESIDLTAQLRSDIDRHVEAYRTHLKAADVSEGHLYQTTHRLRRTLSACGFAKLADIQADSIQQWCNLKTSEGMGARTRNLHVGSLRAFVRWCIADRRMASDPLVTLTKANEAADVRRERRALTEEEFAKLLETASHRPLVDAMTIRRGTYKGEQTAKLTEVERDRLERLGRERRLIYMTLVLTGLRRGELQQLTWADVTLGGPQGWLTVRASVSKSGKTDTLPIRNDLADALREWQKDVASEDDHVFRVPKELVRILHRDLKAAGIDANGLDVHSLRHTTATYLAKA